jgi:hypothetical protein
LKAHKSTRIPSKSLEWSSVEEEKPFPGLGGKMWPGSLNLTELHHGPDANEEAKGKDKPPEPGVLVADEVGAPLHNQRPLGKGKSKSGEGAIACATRTPGSGGLSLPLASSFASGPWCNSGRLSDPGHIFPPKPGNGFSSSTEDHSRLLGGILVDLWAFKVCLSNQFS